MGLDRGIDPQWKQTTLPLLLIAPTGSQTNPLCIGIQFPQKGHRNVKLATHLYLVSRQGTRGTLPCLSDASSRSGDKFNFSFDCPGEQISEN